MKQIILISRMRGWIGPTTISVLAALISILWGSNYIQIPLADGPLRLGTYLVIAIPVVASSVMINPIADFSASLWRERYLRVLDRIMFILQCCSLFPFLFNSSIRGTELGNYYFAISIWMASITAIATQLFGRNGQFTALLIGCMWLFAGNSMTHVLGFNLFRGESIPLVHDFRIYSAIGVFVLTMFFVPRKTCFNSDVVH